MKSKPSGYVATVVMLGMSAFSCFFALASCGQKTATIEEGTGNAWALYKLAQVDPSPAGTAAQQTTVATMGRLESDLESFVAGTLDPTEQGYINGLLANEKLLVPTNANPNVVDQLTSLANIFQTNMVAGPGGTTTPIQNQEIGAAKNAVLGIKAAIKYREGKWSLTNPAAWPVPPTPPSV